MYLPSEVYYYENCNILPSLNEIDRIKNTYSNDYETLIDEISIVLHRIIIQIRNSYNHNEITLAAQIQKFLDDNIEKK